MAAMDLVGLTSTPLRFGFLSQKESLLPAELRAISFDTLVNIGCGNGELLVRLAVRHPQASFIGVEADEALARRTAARIRALALDHRVTIQHADALATGIPTGWADVVVHCLSVQHVATLSAALEEAVRLLRSGGWLFIQDGLRSSAADVAHMDAELRVAGMPPELLPGFDSDQLAHLLRRYGFMLQKWELGGPLPLATLPHTSHVYEPTSFLLVAQLTCECLLAAAS